MQYYHHAITTVRLENCLKFVILKNFLYAIYDLFTHLSDSGCGLERIFMMVVWYVTIVYKIHERNIKKILSKNNPRLNMVGRAITVDKSMTKPMFKTCREIAVLICV